ncbi:MAG: helix-turn-helix domain-containing protein [Sandaracinaceae bacterium]|nr:helix-turn-helix domain-containing protein [Sandaracinaceae bacterium]
MRQARQAVETLDASVNRSETMLDYDTRSAILRLRREGRPPHCIARALKVSRNAVRRVLKSGEAKCLPCSVPRRSTRTSRRCVLFHMSCEGT